MRFSGLLVVSVLLSLTAFGAPPLTAGPCILPVEGEEPMSDVEREQPHRLAWNPITLPGYSGLLLRPINRPGGYGLYEISGRDYREHARPAPGSNHVFDREVRLATGGDHFLAGWDDRALWHLPEGSDDWQRVRPDERWWGTAYDEGTGDFYAGFAPRDPLLRWDGDTFVPAGPMPTAVGDAPSSLTEFGLPVAILTLPKAGGTFAVAMDWFNEDWRSLWFRPSGGEWSAVATKQDLDRMVPGLRFPGPFRDADVSKDGQTVRLFSGDVKDASLILRKGPDGWVLDGFAPYLGWVKHRGTGIRLAWDGAGRQDLTERFLLFFERTVAPKPPVLLILDPGSLEPRPVAGISTSASYINDSVFYSSRIVDIPGVDPLLVETDTGWAAFDGSTFTDLPGLSTTRIGENARISRVGPLVLIQSAKGLFRLTEELEAERVETFPEKQSPSSMLITWLEEARLFVVVGLMDGAVYTSRDFVSFEKTPSPSPIKSAVAALPDRSGMLLVGPDGLYTLEADCP